MNIKWINQRHDLEDLIKIFKSVEKRQKKIEKELGLIRIALNLR